MKHALIVEGNLVLDAFDEVFEVKLPDFWVQCPDECGPGWAYDSVKGEVYQRNLPPAEEDLTQERHFVLYKQEINEAMLTVAHSKDYSSIESVCSYGSSGNENWRNDSQAFCDYRDAVWAYYYDIENQITEGTLEPPLAADLVASMPKITW